MAFPGTALHRSFTVGILTLNNFQRGFFHPPGAGKALGELQLVKIQLKLFPKERSKHLPGHCQGGLAWVVLGVLHQLLLGLGWGTAFFPEEI